MMEKNKVEFILLVMIVIEVIVLIVLARGIYESPLSEEDLCESSEGLWQQFPDTCLDLCGLSDLNNTNCAQVQTYGCECGENRCWMGDGCVDNT